MAEADPGSILLDEGKLPFTIESRLIRELGERLVREPEVALLELVKNAFDADAISCDVRLVGNDGVEVLDDGIGMSFDEFANGWMRIGTSAKGKRAFSRRFGRPITGEKGIGRFAVRYLGQSLKLVTVADDLQRGERTQLEADFEWDEFDEQEDLNEVRIPYRLTQVTSDVPTGTTLAIGRLKPVVRKLDWKALRTGSMGVVSPIRSLLDADFGANVAGPESDPGFKLISAKGDDDFDVADELLAHYALRATVELTDGRLRLRVFRPQQVEPYLTIDDQYPGDIGDVRADIRFFPRRQGQFADAEFDGRRAYTWIRENAGVKVFDRSFQMRPYGTPGDDWLDLTKDAARSLREPVSPIMQKHYPMDASVKSSTAVNWMLRLPENSQIVGVVQVQGRREADGQSFGLVAAADREGFLANEAFDHLKMMIRGALEAMAYADREISLEEARKVAEQKLLDSRAKTREAIGEIEGDRSLTMAQRVRLVEILEESQERSELLKAGDKVRDQQLEIMSLLGVVAGFMTHEFGVALSELRDVRTELAELAKLDDRFAGRVASFDKHIDALRSFVRYSRAYVEGARSPNDKPYAARPRFEHVVAAFGDYARKRRIDIDIDVERDVVAPPVPPALYDGIAQNLFTNSLKALTASSRDEDRRITFRAWNEPQWHYIQVSDNGDGIPSSVRPFIFDPLFTTTDKKSSDPLGSGMGLGLALVRRGAAAFGGTADLVEPPPGFVTCVQVRFPRSIAK